MQFFKIVSTLISNFVMKTALNYSTTIFHTKLKQLQNCHQHSNIIFFIYKNTMVSLYSSP